MPQPSTLFPLAQGLSSPPHPPQAPSRAAGGAMYTVSAGPVQSLQGWPTLHVTRTLTSFSLDHPEPTMPTLGCPMMSYLARAQPSGDLHTAQITLTAPFPPSPLRHAVKCLVGVVGRRVSIVSRVSGSQSSRVNGSQGLNGFKGT